MPRIDAPPGFRFLAARRHGSVISVVRMETIIYVSMEMLVAMKPRAHSDEDAIVEPFGAVIAGGGAVIGSDIVIAIRAIRSHPDFYADLCLRFGGDCDQAYACNSC
jgi:hypothetical protein